MTILAAIDEHERSRVVVEVAADLAETYDDTLVTLHVVPEADFESHRKALRKIPEFTDFSLTQGADSAEQFAEDFVEESIDTTDLKKFEARGRVGNSTEEILTEADSLEPRFLVIGGRRQSPAGKAVFGNTTQQVLLNADCPVVTQLSDE